MVNVYCKLRLGTRRVEPAKANLISQTSQMWPLSTLLSGASGPITMAGAASALCPLLMGQEFVKGRS